MNNDTYILFTAGHGPIECELALQGIQKQFRKHLDDKKVLYAIVNQKKGNINGSMESILFKVQSIEKDLFNSWIGTIQWICKSPIRKYHKRKNWYIKCQEIKIPKEVDQSTKHVTIQSYRASGPGGQHRNKVETAIRIIHNPTGIIVTASDGKSQTQNKKKAWTKLELKLKQRNEEIQKGFITDQWVNQLEIERGNPIRTLKGMKFSSCYG